MDQPLAPYLQAEEPDIMELQDETLSFEEQVMAMMPPEFFVHVIVECADCHTTLNAEDAETAPKLRFVCQKCYEKKEASQSR